MNFPLPYNNIPFDKINVQETPDDHSEDNISDRIKGSLVGLAIGDAIGAHVEFRPYDYLLDNPVKDMEGGGTWGLEAGQWTDDTSMALCIALSLIKTKQFDLYNQMIHFKWWNKYGYLSSTGNCFDIGSATLQALSRFYDQQKNLSLFYHCYNDDEVDQLDQNSVKNVKEFNIYCGSDDAAGNGSLMRIAPISLFYWKNPQLAIKYASQNCRLTHGDQKAIDACRYYSALILGALHRFTKEKICNKNFYEENRDWFNNEPLHENILHILQGSYQKQNGHIDGIRGKGYVVQSLEAALWAFWSTSTFEDGLLAAVNLGDDTDTTASIYGQLAGAFYGYQNIPERWRNKLYGHHQIVSFSLWINFYAKQQPQNQNLPKVIRDQQFTEEQQQTNIKDKTKHSTTSYQNNNEHRPFYQKSSSSLYQ